MAIGTCFHALNDTTLLGTIFLLGGPVFILINVGVLVSHGFVQSGESRAPKQNLV